MADQENKTVTAAVLIIGDEILSGRTQDVNLQFIATWLGERGIQVCEVRGVLDDEEDIVSAVNALRDRYDYVFTTGGIGPTHDDITANSIAKAFGVEVEQNSVAVKVLTQHYEDRITDARLRMARVPVGATLIENPVSKAPGFQLENVFVMAGIPNVAASMLEGLEGRLTGGAPMLSKSVAAPIPESQIADPLGELQDRYPNVSIGSYPYYLSDGYGATLVLRSTDEALLEKVFEELIQIIKSLGFEPINSDAEA